MNDFWKGVLIRIAASIAVFFAFLIFTIVYVSSFVSTLRGGVAVFAISILFASVSIGFIWMSWRSKYRKKGIKDRFTGE